MGKKSSAEDKSKKKEAEGAILNSFKGKLITDFKQRNDFYKVVTKEQTVSYIH